MPPIEAVLLAAIFHMLIGGWWYSTSLYGLRWQSLQHKSSREMQLLSKRGYYASFISALISAYVMAKLMMMIGATTIWAGMSTGLWLWVGFVFTGFVPAYMFAKKPAMLLFIDTGYLLFALMSMGFIISLFI
jgi:hypothetical protein